MADDWDSTVRYFVQLVKTRLMSLIVATRWIEGQSEKWNYKWLNSK